MVTADGDLPVMSNLRVSHAHVARFPELLAEGDDVASEVFCNVETDNASER